MKLVILVHITIAMFDNKPLGNLTLDMSSLRFFTLRNHLSYWSPIIIGSIGLVLSYLYYFNCDDFVPNN
jgi:hypothetical protein